MSQITSAGGNISFERTHKCVGCGRVYSYIVNRSIGGTSFDGMGSARGQAIRQGKAYAAMAIEHIPCPDCGLLQPEMVDDMRGLYGETPLGDFLMSILQIPFWSAAFWFFPRTTAILVAIYVFIAHQAKLDSLAENPNKKILKTKFGVPVPGAMIPEISLLRILLYLEAGTLGLNSILLLFFNIEKTTGLILLLAGLVLHVSFIHRFRKLAPISRLYPSSFNSTDVKLPPGVSW